MPGLSDLAWVAGGVVLTAMLWAAVIAWIIAEARGRRVGPPPAPPGDSPPPGEDSPE
mgnify:CR=1 FL=1